MPLSFIQIIVLFFFTFAAFADQLIIEPDMGRKALQQAIFQTEYTLHLVMYGFTDEQLLNALLDQKKRGRSIHIILERTPYKSEKENIKTIQRLNENHIEWQGHIPPFRLIHQKSLMIDGKKAIIMTFNLTKSTFLRERNFGLVVDDLPTVKEIEAIFSADWNHIAVTSHAANLIFSPDNSRSKLYDLISNAKNSITVYAQSIHDDKLVGALANAARRGVTVRILTSSSLHTKAVDYLLQMGASVHQSQHYYIHAKVMIIDNQKAVIGSINLTSASLDHNRELAVITRNAKVIRQLNATFETDWFNSHQ